jgi:colicin import membrane protein
MSSKCQREKPALCYEDGAGRFAYGWRAVQLTMPDGSITFEQLPLTLEDVLHPEFGDHQALSYAHDLDVDYLRGVLSDRLAADPTTVVLSKVLVYWEKPEWQQHCPDIAAIRGVSNRINWLFFQVADGGTRPSLIIEVVSPNTRVNDVEAKVDEYARVGVPHYVIADACESGGHRCLSLIDYRLRSDGRYDRRALDARRRVWLEEAGGLWLGTFADRELGCDRLALFDPATGARIRDYAEISSERATRWETRAAVPVEVLTAHAELREEVCELRRLLSEGPEA